MLRRLLDSPVTYFAAAGILLLAALSTQFELTIPSRPGGTVEELRELRNRDDLNVVFIVIDTLRADHMGLYGYERPTTPVLDELASRGIVFDSVISQASWTKTSMASLWTATYPANNGILRFDNVIPPEATLPAEIFKQAGYRTAGIWRNGWVAANFGFDQGFDIYHRPRPGSEAELRRGPGPPLLGGTDEDIFTAAQDFLSRFGQEKFFLYCHLMDLHQYVFDEEADEFGTSYLDSYDMALDWTDRVIGVIVSKLDEIGVLDRTVIAIASDHGEAFMEHGLEGHGRDLYRELVHVPFVIVPPLILDRQIRIPTTIGNVDIWPTLLDLVGLPPMEGVDGRSMLPLILAAGGLAAPEPPASLERPVVSHMDQTWGARGFSREIVSVTDREARVMVHLKDRSKNEFYDWSSDPGEQQNRFAENSATAREMVERADAYLEAAKPPWGVESPTVEIDELQLNQLRALGYKVGEPLPKPK